MRSWTWLLVLMVSFSPSLSLRLRNTTRILLGDRERGTGVKVGGGGDRGRLGGVKVGSGGWKPKEIPITTPSTTSTTPEETTSYSLIPDSGGGSLGNSGNGGESVKEVR